MMRLRLKIKESIPPSFSNQSIYNGPPRKALDSSVGSSQASFDEEAAEAAEGGVCKMPE